MRFYEDPTKTSENRLKQRAWYIPENEGAYTLLNGTWRFRYYSRDIDIEQDITQWDTIDVPSCWQSRGYENPNYTNVKYPFPVDPPYVPDDNPCGVYEREFSVTHPERKTYIVFEGIASAGAVYINGKYVGFTTGNHLQSEFDLTEFVRPGVNTLRVVVYKWACTSYLEDQDCFRFNGIFRDVYLLSRPQGHITDFEVTTRENTLTVTFDGTATVTLLDGEQVLFTGQATEKAVISVPDPRYWNAEEPYLYTLKLVRLGETITQKVGFRSICIGEDGQLLVNGVSVKLLGVNRHDTHPVNGWTMTDEELLSELHLMKQLNINCIRTSHYPPTPRYLQYCDELGFYVVLETDMETHGFYKRLGHGEKVPGYDVTSPDWPCQKPEWEQEHVQRMERALERDKNHPSILMWSIGNETGFGDNHKSMVQYLRRRDPSRLVHSECASRKSELRPEYSDERYYSDVYSRMYLSPEDCKEYCQDDTFRQPLFLCEYAHAMGNGPGDLWDYMQLIENYPKFIGGCVWEWADHVVLQEGIAKYGGDWETELTHDGNFCCDGIVFYDRSLKAGSLEMKYVYQPIRACLEQDGIRLQNRYAFRSLKGHTICLELCRDGEVLAAEEKTLTLAPGEEVLLPIPGKRPDVCRYGCYVNLTLTDSQGRTPAREQLLLDIPKAAPAPAAEPCRLEEDSRHIIARGDGFQYTFCKHAGTFVSMKLQGKEQLSAPMKLSTLRAPTDNDRRVKINWLARDGISEHMDKGFCKIYSVRTEGNKIITEGSLAGVSVMPLVRFVQTVSIDADGTVDFDVQARIPENAFWLPRFGYEFALTEPNAAFSYYGMGPGETYCDLHHYAGYGVWESTARQEYVPYVKPQEHGNHYGARFLSFRDGLHFEAEQPFEFRVSQYSVKELMKHRHAAELTTDGTTHVRIDYKVSGIGSNSCGPTLAEQYRLSEKEISFRFRLKKGCLWN